VSGALRETIAWRAMYDAVYGSPRNPPTTQSAIIKVSEALYSKNLLNRFSDT